LYKSDKDDRAFQFWKRDPLVIPVSSEKIFISNLNTYTIILLNGIFVLILKNINGAVQDFIGKVLMGLICLLIIKSSWFMLTKIILLYDYG